MNTALQILTQSSDRLTKNEPNTGKFRLIHPTKNIDGLPYQGKYYLTLNEYSYTLKSLKTLSV